MQKFFLLLGILITQSIYISAQQARPDKELSDVSATDTVQVNRDLQNAQRLRDRAPDSAGILLAHALRLATAIHYTSGIVRYYHAMVGLLINESRFEEAAGAARKEVALAHELHEPLTLARSFNALANAYEYLGIMDSAGKYFLYALRIADSLQDKRLQRRLNNNLSSVLYYSGDYTKGFRYAVKGYTLARSLNDTSAMITSLLNVGGFESALKRYDSSLKHFNEVMVLAKRSHNKLKVMDALNNLGELLSDMGRDREALEKYSRMLTLSRQSGRADYRMYAEGNMGNTLAKLGRYRDGEHYLAEAIRTAENIHASNELQQWLHFMADLQEKQGNYKKGFVFLKRYQGLKDSLMNVSTKQNIHQLEIQYQSLKKDKELADQRLNIIRQQEAIRRKNGWIYLFVVGVTALALILLLSSRNHRNKKRLHRQTVLSLKNEQEMIRLKAIMEGQGQERQRISREMHDDIGSGLTTILFLSNHLKNNAASESKLTGEKIARHVNSLISKMNEIIWSMNTDYDTLQDLAAYIRHNAGELLESAGIHYHFSIPEMIPDVELSGEQRRNIYLAVKEALHNIVKHAQAGLVTIELNFDRQIHISIRDNGKGIDKDQARRFGNGLKNMRRRMESVGGSFEMDDDHGVVVRLIMPLG